MYMKKLLILISALSVFSSLGCTAIGSRDYYAAYTAKGMVHWKDNRGIIYSSKKPDSITYSKDNFKLTIYTNTLVDSTYALGPCMLIPLPVIPVFGLGKAIYSGPISVSFDVEQIGPYQLIKANVLKNNENFLPINIETPLSRSAFNPFTEKIQFPLDLNERGIYFYLEYNLSVTSVDSFELEFTVQNNSGVVFLEDKISFTREKTNYFMCVM